MGFLEQLRGYLERVGRSPEGLPYAKVDVAAHRRFLLEAIERHWSKDPKAAERRRLMWNTGRPFAALVQLVAIDILEEVEPAATANRLAELIDIGIGIYLGARRSGPPIATTGSLGDDDLLYEIMTRAFWTRDKEGPVDAWRFPPRYAFETRLVQRRGENVVLSRCGRMLLETPGIDALRWLLALEAAQSMGVDDDLRVSPELAAHLARYSERHEWTPDDAREPEDENAWRFSLATVRRLGALGLLTYHDARQSSASAGPDYLWGYEVIERHLPLLEDIGQRRPTPHAILADALLRDETAAIVDRVHPDTARMAREGAADVFALQARLVVHEIRNALVPAQVAFDSLLGHLVQSESPELTQRQRSRVESGIQRALDFVDGMLRVANLGVEPPSTFDVDAALHEACTSVSRDLNGNFKQDIHAADTTITGPRTRFILAVTNLLRNAAQAITGLQEGLVSITTEVGSDHVLIHVDDSGPGVPADQRRAIFEPGVALRSGGSGQGLALVRQVVEGEMGGTIACTEGPLGGARFTLRVPARRSRST